MKNKIILTTIIFFIFLIAFSVNSNAVVIEYNETEYQLPEFEQSTIDSYGSYYFIVAMDYGTNIQFYALLSKSPTVHTIENDVDKLYCEDGFRLLLLNHGTTSSQNKWNSSGTLSYFTFAEEKQEND